MIILNADLQLVVADPDASLAQASDLAAEAGGYVVKSESWSDGRFRFAKAEIRIPAIQFREVVDRLKAMSIRVERENITGQDVTEEYIDLDSRLKGLRATADQLRGLLAEAKTVDEALHVSIELGRIEEQIEQVVGRQQYLENRVAFSTITVNLDPERPAVTPTPVMWQPNVTAERAVDFLGASARLTGDVLIWGVIVGVPFALIVFGASRLIRRARRRGRSG
jgi:hypothetical protein